MTNAPTVIKNPTWWKRRTMMERHCTLFATTLSLLCIILVVALALIAMSKKRPEEAMPTTIEALSGNGVGIKGTSLKDEKYEICLTPGCVQAANIVLESMDSSVDPCDDFYKFSCGNFIKESTIPDDKTSISWFSKVDDILTDQLRIIIEEPSTPDESRPITMAKIMYKNCMNKSRIEDVGLTQIKNIVKDLGGWPVLEGDSWDPSSFDWISTTYKFKDKGFSIDYIIDFSITTDVKNSTRRIIDLDTASLSLSREYLIKGMDEKIVAEYYRYMVDIAVIFGADRARAEKELKESLDFEISLANISLPLEERRDATKLYNPMTIPELQEKYPLVPWKEYFTRILPPEVKVQSDEVAINNVPSYITNVSAILSNTPKRIQANYLLWRAVAGSISYLTEEVRKRQLEFGTAISGKTEREPRWKECISVATSSFSLATGSLYVQRFFKEDAKKAALEMVGGIREEMYKILNEVDWMDEKTRQSALIKAKGMSAHIAYPDELLDREKLENYYKNVTVTGEDYLKSLLNLTTFGTNWSFNRLRQPVNKSDWISHGRPAIVNAFYSSIENSIQFPAGILQGTFFSNRRPRYMNFGAIGFVIGHEITHGFDDQGRQFDSEGNLVDWWEPETKSLYLKKASCIIEQYGNYTVEEVGLKLNGINTQGENIADNGGIKQAYRAYNRWVEQNGPEPRLPGLQNYTPQQMFWISAANTWCSKYRPEGLKLRIITGFHSPGEFRVIGPFSNQESFAKDFKCPKGTKMNPVKKCSVW
uniref:Peptidase M13 N-terminal domain-containing protein n=1 Tax=Clastoptera arizonana TaxID=38151 RepID=A0A1B6DD22_9HEMI